MKKYMLYFWLIIPTVLIVFFVLSQALPLLLPEPTIIQAIPSPSGEYTAYIYESNGGATTGFMYHLSIVRTGEKIPKGKGNVYCSGVPVKVVWISEDELYVENYREKVFIQEEEVAGIIITYKHLNK